MLRNQVSWEFCWISWKGGTDFPNSFSLLNSSYEIWNSRSPEMSIVSAISRIQADTTVLKFLNNYIFCLNLHSDDEMPYKMEHRNGFEILNKNFQISSRYLKIVWSYSSLHRLNPKKPLSLNNKNFSDEIYSSFRVHIGSFPELTFPFQRRAYKLNTTILEVVTYMRTYLFARDPAENGTTFWK